MENKIHAERSFLDRLASDNPLNNGLVARFSSFMIHFEDILVKEDIS